MDGKLRFYKFLFSLDIGYNLDLFKDTFGHFVAVMRIENKVQTIYLTGLSVIQYLVQNFFFMYV